MKRALVLLLLCMGVAAAAIERWVTVRSRAGWRRVHAQMALDARSGGLQGLLRARMAGLRAVVSEPHAADVLADLAFISAALAHEYGLPTSGEAEALLTRRADARRGTAGDAAAGAARTLLALQRGDRPAAEKLALAAADDDREDVRPLLALARVRALAGEMVGASKTLEAAIVKAPGAAAPLVQWAEVRIDLGQPRVPISALRAVVAAAPDHARAQLLLAEAQRALGEQAPQASPSSGSTLAMACQRDGAVSPVVAAGCAAYDAVALRLAGERAAAVARLDPIASRPLGEPRTLAFAALVLAQLGRVDRADELLVRAGKAADRRMPAQAWARLAVALGRGQVVRWPRSARPSHPETRLLAARAVLASEGQLALGRMLAELGPAAVASDPDLRALALLAPGAGKLPPGAEPGPALGPVRAYVDGLRARVAGDAAAAARALARALVDHGDACRAAGEYLVVTRLLGATIGGELDQLRASNRACVNLSLPPAPSSARKNRAPGGRRGRAQ